MLNRRSGSNVVLGNKLPGWKKKWLVTHDAEMVRSQLGDGIGRLGLASSSGGGIEPCFRKDCKVMGRRSHL
jgi:hypothetical protein